MSDHYTEADHLEEVFDDDDYPWGCRCGVCSKLFEHGQPVIRRFQGSDWTFLVCVECLSAPLKDGHPLNENNVVLGADGTVGVSGPIPIQGEG